MSIVAFTSEGIKVSSTRDGVIISQFSENWGDPWQTPEYTITVNNIPELIRALQEVKLQKDYDEW